MIDILRKAEVTEHCVILRYYLFDSQTNKTLHLSDLTKIFSSLTPEEIRQAFEDVFRKIDENYDITTIYFLEDMVGGMMGTCIIEVTVCKSKKLIRKAHRKIMKRIKEALGKAKQQSEDKLLREWLWKERILKFRAATAKK